MRFPEVERLKTHSIRFKLRFLLKTTRFTYIMKRVTIRYFNLYLKSFIIFTIQFIDFILLQYQSLNLGFMMSFCFWIMFRCLNLSLKIYREY